MKKLKVSNFIILPIVVGLVISMLINGIMLIQGSSEIVIKFLNFYSRDIVTDLPFFVKPLMVFTGFLQLMTAIVLLFGIFKFEFMPNKTSSFLKIGIFIGILSITTYGFAVRMISNHQAAANLFYYLTFLYLLLWYVERYSNSEMKFFNKIKLLPIFIILMFTMGQPGFQKLFNSSAVIPNYVKMFDGSILSQMPGGIPPFIYFLGIMEFSVPIILLISLLRKEFLKGDSKPFFSIAAIITIATFVMLNFGLTIITNYPGATNLIFYAISTLWLYYYAIEQKKQV